MVGLRFGETLCSSLRVMDMGDGACWFVSCIRRTLRRWQEISFDAGDSRVCGVVLLEDLWICVADRQCILI